MFLGVVGIVLSVVYALAGVLVGSLAVAIGWIGIRRSTKADGPSGESIAALVTGIVSIVAGMVNSTLAVVFLR